MADQNGKPNLFTIVALVLFYGYAICMTLLTYLPIASVEEASRQLTPLLGWVPAMFYTCPLIFLFEKNLLRTCGTNLVFMLLAVFSGLIDVCSKPDIHYGNLYLDHDPYRPIFTLVLPIFWAVLMILSMKQLMQSTAQLPLVDTPLPGAGATNGFH